MVNKQVLLCMALLLFGAFAFLEAGTVTRNSFTLVNNGINDSNLIKSGQAVALAVKRTTIIKLYGDTLSGAPENTFYPDISMRSPDTIETYFVATSARQIKTQTIYLRQDGTSGTGSRSRLIDLKNVTRSPYLHIDRGTNGFLASYTQEIDASSKNYFVMLHNGTRALTTDTSDGRQWIASTQCHMAGDTFIVMTMVDTSVARMYKVYSRGATLVKTDSVVVISGASPGVINGALAADSAGTICAALTRGKFNNTKYLDYSFFSRDLTPGLSAVLTPPIGENVFYQYDDVAITSYGRGKFALVSWDGSGILLHKIRLSGNTVTHDTVRAVKKNGMKFCAVASSKRYMVIAGLGDADGNGVRCIEGVRYVMVNGEPDSAVALSYSDAKVAVANPDSSYSSAINVTVDDSGTIGVVWRNSGQVNACVWTHRSIRHEQSFFRSPVDSLNFNGDSIRFNPIAVSLSNSQYWNTSSFLRTGKTVAACTTASWLSFTDTSVLSANRMTNGYYQSKVYLKRTPAVVTDSFATPTISAYTVSWNVQPGIASIDTLRTPSLTRTPFSTGDTIEVVSRKDSVTIALTARDADAGDVVSVQMSALSTPQLRSLTLGTQYKGSYVVHPFERSDTTYICTLTVKDQRGWYGAPQTIRCRTRNSLPAISLLFRQYISSLKITDSLVVSGDTTFIIQQEDTVRLSYSIADSNDNSTVRGALYLVQGGDSLQVDSMQSSEVKSYTVFADTLRPVDTIRFLVRAVDADTTIDKEIKIIVNHVPVLTGVVYGEDTLRNGDTTGVVIDDTAYFHTMVRDTDCAYGDTLSYTIATMHQRDSVVSVENVEVLSIVPDKDDTVMMVKVTDRFGRSDSMRIHLTYPWFETDSEKNPDLAASLHYAADSVALISGSTIGDTVLIPIKNIGGSPLLLSNVSFTGKSDAWLGVQIRQVTDTITVTSRSGPLDSVVIIPEGAMIVIALMLHADKLTGDTLYRDTVVLHTNDPRHKRVKIPVLLETNDLPRVVSVMPYFIADAPYRPFAKKQQYLFPPHAQIAIAFSEPMDTASAQTSISIYSIFDKNATGVMQQLPLTMTWLQNNTVVHIAPSYVATSPYFKLKPPAGLFIPTDSIAIKLTDGLLDIATTPSGPNRLDVDNDLLRQAGRDTTLYLRIDSITFTVAAISPPPGDASINRTLSIRLDFSSPLYSSTVDTSLHNNRSFRVVSSYNNSKALEFSSIDIDSSSVTFGIAQELFYSDSLQCAYSSRWIRDSLGFSTDNSGDGIDVTIFDSLSGADNLQWGYRVRPIRVEATSPESASVLTEVSPEITIRFNDKLAAGIIDFDTSKDNRSFRIGSGRTGYTALHSISLLPDSTGIVVLPKVTFFSNDSVYCEFRGFTSNYRYTANVNLPAGVSDTMSRHGWYFRSGEIGFYTFPNPYKPSSNPKHCGSGGPCGIWFKNLHTLGKDIEEVAVVIFSMNAHPVFDSRKKGVRIRFTTSGSDNLPEWKWDTRNTKGELVATGLYFYALYSTNGTVLKKGKLIIVR